MHKGPNRSSAPAPTIDQAAVSKPWMPTVPSKPWDPVAAPKSGALRPPAYLYLTGKESALLELLTIAAGEPISSEELLGELNPEANVQKNTIEAHVHNLRRKLRHHPDVRIETVRSQGYRLSYVEPPAA